MIYDMLLGLECILAKLYNQHDRTVVLKCALCFSRRLPKSFWRTLVVLLPLTLQDLRMLQGRAAVALDCSLARIWASEFRDVGS